MILFRYRFCSALLCVALVLAVQAADSWAELAKSAAATAAELAKDPGYTEFDHSFTAPGERPVEADSPAQIHWDFVALDAMLQAGENYLNRYPESPHSWRVLARMNGVFIRLAGRLVTPADYAAVVDVMDAASLKAWPARFQQLRGEVLASSQISAADKLQLEMSWLQRYVSDSARLKEAFDQWDAWRRELDRLAMANPDADDIAAQYDLYLRIRQARDPSVDLRVIRAEWVGLLKSPSHSTAERAVGKINALDLEIAKESGLQGAPPLELAFTAVDGREVDMKNLRGKVVLIDFWATWCGPCIAELPNVKAVYDAYHDQGFEVVGISLENGKLTPKDTPEQTAAKLAKAKQILLNFTSDHGMPWPQYFDGKWWKNEISTRYAIGAIPAMFLVDQNGKIVSTNARGPKLKSEVQRLLGL